MNHVKTFKGWPPRDAPSEMVQLWYKTCQPDYDGRMEIKNPTKLSNKTSTAWSCAEDQILENKISGTGISTFVLNDRNNTFLKSIDLEGNINDCLGRADIGLFWGIQCSFESIQGSSEVYNALLREHVVLESEYRALLSEYTALLQWIYGSFESIHGSFECIQCSFERICGSWEWIKGSSEWIYGSFESIYGFFECMRGSLESIYSCLI